MKTQLNDVTGKNRFCGPTAIAAILGITTDEAARAVRGISGQRKATGVLTKHLVLALRQLGCVVTHHIVSDKPTASRWVKENRTVFAKRHVVLVHGNHFGTLLGNRFLCSLSKRYSVPLSDLPKKRGRVSEYLIIESLPATVQVPTKPEPTGFDKEIASDRRSFKARAMELAKLHSVQIEQDNAVTIWVCGPDGMFSYEKGNEQDDPYFEDHVCGSWAEALERVNVYIQLGEKHVGR